jgi:hypothetical protein
MLAVVACVAVSCGTTESRPDPPSSTPAPSGRADAVTLDGAPRTVTTDLQAPWSVVFRDDTALVSERDSGRILELLDDGSTRVVATIAGVASGGEAGLLGIAVDDRGRLYVYSTGRTGTASSATS